MRKIPHTKLEICKNLFNCGLSLRKIEKRLKISRSVINKYLRSEGIKLENKGGSPRKTSDKLQKLIVRNFKNGFFKNSTDAKKYLANNHNLNVSNQTIRNILKKAQGKSRVKRLKPLLKPEHKKARRKFTRVMMTKPFSYWESTIFTDESKYNLFGPDGNKKCWVFPDAINLDHQVRQRIKFGGGSVMVYGAITFKGVGKLAFIDGRMNADHYINILSTHYIETLNAHKIDIKNSHLVQDNDPKHKAKKVQTWLNDTGIDVVEWPSNSPDMNIIEHVWNDIEVRLRARPYQPRDFDELKSAVEEEWKATTVDYIQSLYYSIPRRLEALKKAKGGHTKY